MKSIFSSTPRKAKLSLTYDDGTVQVVDFYVRSLDLKHDADICHFGYGQSYVAARSCEVTLTGQLDASASFVVSASKKEKPMPKPEVPTVKTSSLRLRKADKAATLATNKLLKLEAALQHAKVVKGLADTERKLATEALLASAIA